MMQCFNSVCILHVYCGKFRISWSTKQVHIYYINGDLGLFLTSHLPVPPISSVPDNRSNSWGDRLRRLLTSNGQIIVASKKRVDGTIYCTGTKKPSIKKNNPMSRGTLASVFAFYMTLQRQTKPPSEPCTYVFFSAIP